MHKEQHKGRHTVSKLIEARRLNGRTAIEKAGGVGKVAKKLGYSNPSFLVQQFGPNPNRNPTETTMRKMESALGLTPGELDSEPGTGLDNRTPINIDLITAVIRIVGASMSEEHVDSLPPIKHAELIAIALADAIEHGDQPRVDHIRALVRLMRT